MIWLLTIFGALKRLDLLFKSNSDNENVSRRSPTASPGDDGVLVIPDGFAWGWRETPSSPTAPPGDGENPVIPRRSRRGSLRNVFVDLKLVIDKRNRPANF